MPATYLQVHVHIKVRIKRAKQPLQPCTEKGHQHRMRERWEDTNYGESVSVDGQYLGG